MKCRLKEGVSCWVVDRAKPIPVWAARKCHLLGGIRYTVNTILGTMKANQGDVVMLVDEEDNAVALLTKAEFDKDYEVVDG